MKSLNLVKSSVGESILAFCLKISSALVGFYMFSIIASKLGSSEFGDFTVMFSVVMFFSTLNSCGLQSLIIKYFPRYEVAKDSELLSGLVFFSCVVFIFISVVNFILFSAIYEYLNLPLDNTAKSYMYLFVVSFAFSHVLIALMRVLDKTLLGLFLRDFLWRVLVTILLLSCLVYTVASDVLVVMSLSILPIILVGLVITVRQLSRHITISNDIALKKWSVESSSFCLILVVSSADIYIYTMLISQYLDAVEVGVFFTSIKIAELINLVFISVALVFSTKISKAIASKNTELTQILCRLAVLIAGLPSIGFAFLIFAMSPFLLQLFSPEYVEYSEVLFIVLSAVLLNALSGVTGLVMQLTGKHWLLLILQSFFLGIAIFLCPFFMDLFGVLGVGYAYFLSKGLWNIVVVIYLYKVEKINTSFLSVGFYFVNKNEIVNDFKRISLS